MKKKQLYPIFSPIVSIWSRADFYQAYKNTLHIALLSDIFLLQDEKPTSIPYIHAKFSALLQQLMLVLCLHRVIETQFLTNQFTMFCFLICFSINLLVFYRKCHSLIGYATRYLFRFRQWVWRTSLRLLTKWRPLPCVFEVFRRRINKIKFQWLV